VISADDYGYAPAYDAGLVEAASAGAVDAVSVMVLREGCDPAPLLATGVEIGLHLELPDELVEAEWAGPAERGLAVEKLADQLARFEALFGRPAAYLDGHHHRHAAPGLASAVARVARDAGLGVRSVDARHRRLLRCMGVATANRLVGRLREDEPPLPPEIEAIVDGRDPPRGATEWMVHPGRSDPSTSSSYDAAREEDLAILLELAPNPRLRSLRATHAAAL
jgi:chitin disaccharide deacetylase